jgi:tRNA threonylcarbamoyladenosine biosynthesis protein TsaE
LPKATGIFDMELLSGSVKETLGIAGKIARRLGRGDIVCLSGELGSGKTVFAKGLAMALGIKKDKVISPTFVLIRQHKTKDKIPFYHFDLYRLESCADIAVLGYEEFFYGNGITVIEWADRLRRLMPKECLQIKFNVKGKGSRLIGISCRGEHYRKLMEVIREDIRR